MKVFTFLFSCTLFFSCARQDGLIEKRDANCFGELNSSSKIFLVNNNRSKKFKFTCRVTEIINDKAKNYSTIFQILQPGDEIFLGCSEKISPQLYGEKDSLILYSQEQYYTALERKKLIKTDERLEAILKGIKEENKKQPKLKDSQKARNHNPFAKSNSLLQIDEILEARDTIINGKRQRYKTFRIIDYNNKLPRTHTKYEYEVTGAFELKK